MTALISTIILNESTNAKEFLRNNIIHQDQFDGVISAIGNFVSNDLESEYAHNTITLLGTRGSGKTSFLLSLRDYFGCENKKKDGVETHKALQVLDIIDPTLIEEKGHVFLNLIAAVCDLVENHFTSSRCNPDKYVRETEKDWKNSVTTLAAGLPSIDHLARDSEFSWQDPEYVMENELRAVGAAQNLRKNFNKFLAKSLKILDKKAFLILFDDIDVDSSKGYAVLETIRKYFTTGKIVTVLSGDFKLYNSLIRQSKWKNFGGEILRYEASKEYEANSNSRRIYYYDDMVTDLTSQYLLKIMQPQYRFQLETVYSAINSAKKPNINLGVDKEGEFLPLEKALQKIFAQIGINNDYQLESQKHFLLNQPLRTIVHFLQRIIKAINTDDVVLNHNANIASVLLADLYEKNINIELLANSPKFINIEILKLLVREKQIKELYQVSPTSSDNSLNAGVFSLNILFSNAIIKYRFLIFDYFVRISYLRNIIDYYSDNITLDRGLIKESGVLNDLVLRDIMNSLQIYHFAKNSKQSDLFSLINLPGLKAKAKQRNTEQRLDSVFNDISVSDAQRVLGYMPCLAGDYLYSKESKLFYSIYTLLSSIGELLKRYDLSKDGNINLKLAFTELSQIRYYSIQGKAPNERNIPKNENELDDIDEVADTSENQDTSIDALTDSTIKWMEEFKDNRLSIHLLGKSFTRFYVGISNLMNSHKEEDLGRLFHLCVLSFMNSVLIEEVRENLSSNSYGISDLNHSNIVGSERTFIENLKKVIESRAKAGFVYTDGLPFSCWILKCPILLAYLDYSNERLINSLSEFYESSGLIMSEFNIYDLLTKVSLSINESKVKKADNNIDHWKTDGSFASKLRYAELIKLLEDDEFDMTLFKNIDLSQNTSNNVFIRERLPLFKTSTQIRNFRKYLKEEGYFTK